MKFAKAPAHASRPIAIAAAAAVLLVAVAAVVVGAAEVFFPSAFFFFLLLSVVLWLLWLCAHHWLPGMVSSRALAKQPMGSGASGKALAAFSAAAYDGRKRRRKKDEKVYGYARERVTACTNATPRNTARQWVSQMFRVYSGKEIRRRKNKN